MPIQDCETPEGEKGKQFGDTGKCYTGPDAEEKAAKQGRAIEWSKHSKDKKPVKKKTKSTHEMIEEDIDQLNKDMNDSNFLETW